MKRYLWIFALVMLMVAATSAQQPGVTVIGETNGLLVAYTPGGLDVLADDTTTRRDNLRVSPDGRNVLYTASSPQQPDPRLMWLQRGTDAQPTTLTDTFEPSFGGAFSADGQAAYYVQPVPNADIQPAQDARFDNLPVNLTRHPLSGEPEVVGSFGFGVGCGGASPYPMTGAYEQDAGFRGNSLILQMTDAGIAHSTACNGTGLMLTNPQTGENQMLSEDFARGSLSPDGTQMAGVQIDYTQPTPQTTLTIVDFTDGEVRPLETAAMPDQVHWAADGSIYYSTRTETAGNYDVDPAQLQGFRMSPDEIPSYEVSIYRLNIQSGAEEPVYNTSGAWAVGRMRSTTNALYFSLVPDASAWLALITSEAFDASADTYAQEARAVQPDLYRLPFIEGTPALVREDVQQFALAP